MSEVAGVHQLSLSVDAEDPAAQLYLRSGFEELSRDSSGIRMLKRL
jgi:hypothetical protein